MSRELYPMESKIVNTGTLSERATSPSSDDIDDLVKDIKTFNDCFMDLVPTLENPAKNPGQEGTASDCLAVFVDVTESTPYMTNIVDKYPSIDKEFAQRLGEANWRRHIRLREKLSSTPEENELGRSNDGCVVAAYTPLQSETTKSGSSGPSIWDPSSGEMSFTYVAPTVPAPPSMTSFASSFGNDETNKTRRYVPQLPEDHDWFSTFRCFVCGDMVKNVRNRAGWK
jgi:hypothetical protein